MFKSRKKVKEGGDAPDTGASPVKQGTIFRRKKQQPTVEPQIDISAALPSSDDFRTSLLMPNLSARFSMLREQDDPNSKLGKANDDSVLFPKRVSRLNLFAHNPLTDIDETSSMTGAIRPPFLTERSNSVSSEAGYGSDTDSVNAGSIMSRSKPGQGNNLFGGRQKLYAIPLGSQSTKTVVSSGLGGRQIYENDVKPSAFQKLKEQQKQLVSGNGDDDDDDQQQQQASNEDPEPVGSPSTAAFSRNRGTTSSTNSAPSNKRTSTAATSIDSQPSTASQLPKSNSQTQLDLTRQTTLHRRLYGQALEQNTNARDIIEDITRHRAGSNDRAPHPLLQSKSATNLNEKPQRNAPVYTSSFFRSASPPPSATSPADVPMDLGVRDSDASEKTSEHAYGYVPPLSPPISESDGATVFASSLQPTDRGKATAMGLFNKPSKQYDEHQFTQRQMQMHSSAGRNMSTRTPPPNKTPPPTGALPSIPIKPASRTPSNASSAGSRPPSINTGMHSDSSRSFPTKHEPSLPPLSVSPPVAEYSRGTFLDPISPSETSDGDQFAPVGGPVRQQMSIEDIHPAFREPTPIASSPVPESVSETNVNYGIFGRSSPTDSEPDDLPTDVQAGDSPTLGPVGGMAGLIRTHLRHDSDRSLLPPSPMLLPQEETQQTKPAGIRAQTQPESMHSNPFEYDLTRQDTREQAEQKAEHQPERLNEPTAAMLMSEKARRILGQATALREQNMNKQQRRIGTGATQQPDEASEQQPMRTWQEEMELRHVRTESSDTQQDQEDFNNELAERRRRVRENLRSVAESNVRSDSPAPPIPEETRQPKGGNTFSVLRTKTSRQTMNLRPAEHSSKAMDMLGLGAATMSSGSGTSPRAEMWRDEEERMLQDFSKRPGPRPARSPLLPHRTYTPSHSVETASEESLTSGNGTLDRHQSPAASPPEQRSTGGLNHSQSKFDRRYRDDLEQAMDEGRSSIARDYFPQHQTATAPPMPHRPSIDTVHSSYDRSASAASGRYRSDSRVANPAASNYFDSKTLLPVQSGNAPDNMALPRPSPLSITPYSANSTPPLSMESSPTVPGAEMMPLASRSTPQLPIQAPRKRSVTKGMISEPTFLSTTNTIPTYGLSHAGPTSNPVEFPPVSQHAVDREISPPVPMMNPRRRRTTINQQDSPSSSGRQTPVDYPPPPRSANALHIHLPPSTANIPPTLGSAILPHENPDERFMFSDEDKQRPKPRQKLRKSSSEGGNLNSRARAERLRAELSPGLPTHGSHQGMAMYRGPGGGHPMQGPGRSPGLSPNQQQYHPHSPGPHGPYGPLGPPGHGQAPGPRMRTRTPTNGYPPMAQNPYRPMPPHSGRPMGWEDPSRSPLQVNPGPPPPPQMQMGRPPVRAGGPPGYGSGRTTPSGPSSGHPTMRAPSRQRERIGEGAMF